MSSADEGEPPAALDSPALDRWPTYPLDHTIEAVGSDGEQCTIYPSNVDEESELTAWITAKDDSFVAIDEIQ
ncbi:DUF7511 domain-containing protein [Haloplanus aerogenes]|uniref:DUF7511 domain-containing protein n=1 Tax=Haloplanus aerogenes TaxID=660522 RepID=A0A3M0DRN0_9EURY|nr:hypothetical protein [Haloplanus aerogenes]AZH24265.1 hypothetical protein DU502_02255 [Haloplanus aerogenes]RMB24104.1 hypothetical protein ATH50_1342 [Haloplanus aerogenes]